MKYRPIFWAKTSLWYSWRTVRRWKRRRNAHAQKSNHWRITKLKLYEIHLSALVLIIATILHLLIIVIVKEVSVFVQSRNTLPYPHVLGSEVGQPVAERQLNREREREREREGERERETHARTHARTHTHTHTLKHTHTRTHTHTQTHTHTHTPVSYTHLTLPTRRWV